MTARIPALTIDGGGGGVDTLHGGSEDDILIGDYYSLSESDTDLLALRALWTANKDYSTRIASLQTKLNASTVISDTAVDSLFGDGDLDWFWRISVGSRKKDRDRQVIGSQIEAVFTPGVLSSGRK